MLSKLYFLYDKKSERPVSNGGTRLYAYNTLAVARRVAGTYKDSKRMDVTVRQCIISSEINPNWKEPKKKKYLTIVT